MLIYYAFVNGLIMVGNIFFVNWYWLIGLVTFVFIFIEENKEIEEEYEDVERTIL